MKKMFIGVLSVIFVAGTMVSCGKTTKGKMSQDWNFVSSTSTETASNGVEKRNASVDGTKYVEYVEKTPTSGSIVKDTINATVNAYTYSFKKDGTFEMVSDMTYTETQSYGTVTVTNTQTYKTVTSGTWSFIGTNKTDSFKTNERFIMNITKEATDSKSTTSYSDNTPASNSSSSSSDTYKVGENVRTYTVKESTKDKLVLTEDYSNTSTYSQGTSSNTSTHSYTSELTLGK